MAEKSFRERFKEAVANHGVPPVGATLARRLYDGIIEAAGRKDRKAAELHLAGFVKHMASTPVERHNPDLDAVMGAPASPPPPPATNLRINPDLDAAFGVSPPTPPPPPVPTPSPTYGVKPVEGARPVVTPSVPKKAYLVESAPGASPPPPTARDILHRMFRRNENQIAKLAKRPDETRAFIRTLAEMPSDRVRRGAFADYLEERGLPISPQHLRILRTHDGPVTVYRYGGQIRVRQNPLVTDEERRRIHEHLRPGSTPDNRSIVLTDDDSEPRAEGSGYHFTTPAGDPVRHPVAYMRAFGRPVYNASTRHITVGRKWLRPEEETTENPHYLHQPEQEAPFHLAKQKANDPTAAAFAASVAQMPSDRVRRGALADYLEEGDKHHNPDTLGLLRAHEGPVVVFRHPESGRVHAIPDLAVSDIRTGIDRRLPHWSSPSTMRAFGTRFSNKAFSGPGGHFFVTSEHGLRAHQDPRVYIVRQYLPEGDEEYPGEVLRTVQRPGSGLAMFHNSMREAVAYAKRLAAIHGDERVKLAKQPETLKQDRGYGWISPQGEWHNLGGPVGRGWTHTEYAQRELKFPTIQHAFDNGWARVYHYGPEVVAHLPGRSLTERQKSELIDHAIIHGFDKASHDTEDRDKILWTRDEDGSPMKLAKQPGTPRIEPTRAQLFQQAIHPAFRGTGVAYHVMRLMQHAKGLGEKVYDPLRKQAAAILQGKRLALLPRQGDAVNPFSAFGRWFKMHGDAGTTPTHLGDLADRFNWGTADRRHSLDAEVYSLLHDLHGKGDYGRTDRLVSNLYHQSRRVPEEQRRGVYSKIQSALGRRVGDLPSNFHDELHNSIERLHSYANDRRMIAEDEAAGNRERLAGRPGNVGWRDWFKGAKRWLIGGGGKPTEGVRGDPLRLARQYKYGAKLPKMSDVNTPEERQEQIFPRKMSEDTKALLHTAVAGQGDLVPLGALADSFIESGHHAIGSALAWAVHHPMSHVAYHRLPSVHDPELGVTARLQTASARPYSATPDEAEKTISKVLSRKVTLTVPNPEGGWHQLIIHAPATMQHLVNYAETLGNERDVVLLRKAMRGGRVRGWHQDHPG